MRDASQRHRQVQSGHLPHHVPHLPHDVLDDLPQHRRRHPQRRGASQYLGIGSNTILKHLKSLIDWAEFTM